MENASYIGLFPKLLSDRACILGNAALRGAARLLLDASLRMKVQTLVSRASHLDLGGSGEFNDAYVENMMF